MALKFKDWLVDQQEREDTIGEFARVLTMQDITQKAPGRKLDEHKSWADIVVRIEKLGQVSTFNEAWQEFTQARQAATSPNA